MVFTNPSKKICSSNGIISPRNRGEHTKPSPSLNTSKAQLPQGSSFLKTFCCEGNSEDFLSVITPKDFFGAFGTTFRFRMTSVSYDKLGSRYILQDTFESMIFLFSRWGYVSFLKGTFPLKLSVKDQEEHHLSYELFMMLGFGCKGWRNIFTSGPDPKRWMFPKSLSQVCCGVGGPNKW